MPVKKALALLLKPASLTPSTAEQSLDRQCRT